MKRDECVKCLTMAGQIIGAEGGRQVQDATASKDPGGRDRREMGLGLLSGARLRLPTSNLKVEYYTHTLTRMNLREFTARRKRDRGTVMAREASACLTSSPDRLARPARHVRPRTADGRLIRNPRRYRGDE